jgi:hypothetical protein
MDRFNNEVDRIFLGGPCMGLKMGGSFMLVTFLEA